MLEIIVLIAVVKAFTKLAAEKNLNKTLWGLVGAASYYIPILVMSFFILPALILHFDIRFDTYSYAVIVTVLINLMVGSICCFTAYKVLENKNSKKHESDILDDDLI